MSPFTLADAIEIAEDFEDLKDSEFSISSPVIFLVDDVVISPFPEEDKQSFIAQYYATNDREHALDFYTGTEYDVLVFAHDADNETDKVHMNIMAFAEQNGIGYSFP